MRRSKFQGINHRGTRAKTKKPSLGMEFALGLALERGSAGATVPAGRRAVIVIIRYCARDLLCGSALLRRARAADIYVRNYVRNVNAPPQRGSLSLSPLFSPSSFPRPTRCSRFGRPWIVETADEGGPLCGLFYGLRWLNWLIFFWLGRGRLVGMEGFAEGFEEMGLLFV